MDEVLYFFITLIVSTIFSMGGLGSAPALVAIFPLLGLSLNVAKLMSLFIATSSTLSASIMNAKRGVLDFKFSIPLILSTAISAPFGAYFSQYIDEKILQILFFIFLLTSATLIFIKKDKNPIKYKKGWILYLIGLIAGAIAGLLGVGGGSLVLPILILFGFDAKKSAINVSFMIPFSTFFAFLTYLSFTDINWNILYIVGVAAIIGGYLGGKIMHYNLSSSNIKKILGVILYILSIKILFGLF